MEIWLLRVFLAFKTLFFGDNALSVWLFVDVLNVFFKFEDVWLSGNLFVSVLLLWYEIIVCVDKFVALNGFTVFIVERKDFEIWYLCCVF